MAPKRGRAASVPSKKEDDSRQQDDAVKVDPWRETLGELLQVLESDAELTPAARDMLRVVAPFSLRPARSERHRFQDGVADVLRKSFLCVQASAAASSKSIEDSIAENAVALERTNSIAGAAQAREAELRSALDTATAAMSAATADVAAARQGVKEAQSKVDGMEKEHASVVTEKTAREAFMSDTWAALKDNTVAPVQWRRRNKMVDEVMHLLDGLHAEKSLQAALVIAFKQKVGERKFYANTAVRMGEEILEKSLADINTRIANFDFEKNQVAEKVKAEEAHVASKVFAEQAQIEEGTEAGKKHFEASEALRSAEKETEAAARRAKELQGQLSNAQAKLDSISASLARLDDLIEREATVVPPDTCTSSTEIGSDAMCEPNTKVPRVEPNE